MTTDSLSGFHAITSTRPYRVLKTVFLYVTTNLLAVTALLWGGVYIAALLLTGAWPHP